MAVNPAGGTTQVVLPSRPSNLNPSNIRSFDRDFERPNYNPQSHDSEGDGIENESEDLLRRAQSALSASPPDIGFIKQAKERFPQLQQQLDSLLREAEGVASQAQDTANNLDSNADRAERNYRDALDYRQDVIDAGGSTSDIQAADDLVKLARDVKNDARAEANAAQSYADQAKHTVNDLKANINAVNSNLNSIDNVLAESIEKLTGMITDQSSAISAGSVEVLPTAQRDEIIALVDALKEGGWTPAAATNPYVEQLRDKLVEANTFLTESYESLEQLKEWASIADTPEAHQAVADAESALVSASEEVIQIQSDVAASLTDSGGGALFLANVDFAEGFNQRDMQMIAAMADVMAFFSPEGATMDPTVLQNAQPISSASEAIDLMMSAAGVSGEDKGDMQLFGLIMDQVYLVTGMYSGE
jgi:uncharacterized coiled-coil DUF342 family protein